MVAVNDGSGVLIFDVQVEMYPEAHIKEVQSGPCDIVERVNGGSCWRTLVRSSDHMDR